MTSPGHLHPSYDVSPRPLMVVEVRDLTPEVRHVVLVDPHGTALTPHEPGAHLVVTTTPSGPDSGVTKRNAYSLTGDGVLPRQYAISVLRKDAPTGFGDESGGSVWMHGLEVGDVIEVEGPRSSFAPRHDQRHCLLLAGGIGVTPVLSHARAAVRWGGSVEVLYSYRPGHAAHLDDLHALAEAPGVSLRMAVTVDETLALLRDRLADQPLGTHAYACGPPALLAAYLEAGRAAGWTDERLHLERFSAPALDPGSPFSALIVSSGRRVDVAPGTSLLVALHEAGVAVPSLCRQGVCGECVVPVRSGRLEHRDLVLSDVERRAGDRMLSCVSRGAGPDELIEVDL
ncbi:PDR/VanB family oxidoreductase [Nocardioides sp.]|uniref:PDR/VanB family oxidoreductase n=1 Tax=Nocardioides sp. TaxID=35761 RepID=UPI0026353185|nr:PDR/VanB family oxidoreductase [Nocardioides sp.]